MTEPARDAGLDAGADGTRLTEPGSDLPGAGADDLREVADEAAQASAEAQAAQTASDGPEPGPVPGSGAGPVPGSADGSGAEPDAGPGSGDPLGDALGLAEQRLGDLLRERAEFVNYRRRVERDREVAGEQGRAAVLTALLPVLDDIDGARTHGDLVGPFASVADKLDGVLRRLGLEPFGEPGDVFDPALHEALLQDGATQVDVPTCTQVLQRGYRSGERVLRPARVAVASPA